MTKKVKEIEVQPEMSDSEFSKHEGKFFNAKDKGMRIFTEDVDVYAISHPDDIAAGHPKRKLLLKFRKNVFDKEKVQLGWDAFRLLAISSRTRGASAGPINVKGVYWSHRKPVDPYKWSTRYRQPNGTISKMLVNNVVASGIIGHYERTPFLGLPCRITGYTRRGLKQYLHGIPFLEAIDAEFKHLVPDAYKIQKDAVSKKPLYQIADTAFSTLTINLNFRTALHKDVGDFKDGFGNLSVIEWGRYHGGETMFPRYNVGVDLRTGDFVAMDVHEWHCNSELYETKEDKVYNKQLPDIRTHAAETGLIGSRELYQRLSFVCYYREKLSECKEAETRDYYKKIKFDFRSESAAARRMSMCELPLPGITGTIEEAEEATHKKGVLRRTTRRRRNQTERLRIKKHFI